ncbi:Putative F-box domain-containing protein [Colletotrichum destructivum]|uniref:F-box domain-containing protein n=1 Tax=Colletotrichum destructivum TaxID=34406 RepID=A0AAX4IY93_9PEZI|nr:Putative F-box domain-containing protein [Colletotrichum destructivum]
MMLFGNMEELKVALASSHFSAPGNPKRSVYHAMFSTSLGKKQWTSRWDGFPTEIRLQILQYLMQDGCTLYRLATVSREWQTQIERHSFARIRPTPSRRVNFGTMIQRNRALVRYIWFCLELDEYDYTTCVRPRRTFLGVAWEEEFEISDTDKCPITTAFRNLFAVLSTWDLHNDLMLDISIYSPSDSEHCFP